MRVDIIGKRCFSTSRKRAVMRSAPIKLAHYEGVLETQIILHNEGLIRLE